MLHIRLNRLPTLLEARALTLILTRTLTLTQISIVPSRPLAVRPTHLIELCAVQVSHEVLRNGGRVEPAVESGLGLSSRFEDLGSKRQY
jgi:hypothetical protein